MRDVNALRVRLGWTPSDLAKVLGVPQTIVNDWIHGFTEPDRDLSPLWSAVRFDPTIGHRALTLFETKGRPAATALIETAARAAKEAA